MNERRLSSLWRKLTRFSVILSWEGSTIESFLARAQRHLSLSATKTNMTTGPKRAKRELGSHVTRVSRKSRNDCVSIKITKTFWSNMRVIRRLMRQGQLCSGKRASENWTRSTDQTMTTTLRSKTQRTNKTRTTHFTGRGSRIDTGTRKLIQSTTSSH